MVFILNRNIHGFTPEDFAGTDEMKAALSTNIKITLQQTEVRLKRDILLKNNGIWSDISFLILLNIYSLWNRRWIPLFI